MGYRIRPRTGFTTIEVGTDLLDDGNEMYTIVYVRKNTVTLLDMYDTLLKIQRSEIYG